MEDTTATQPRPDVRGPAEQHKELVRQVYEDIRSEGNVDLADTIFAADYVGYDPTAMPPEVRGPEGFKEQTRGYRAAFPDLRFSIESLVADDDEVMVRWTAAGTHRNSMAGETPTGKRIEVSGFGSWRISGGKVAEHWGVFDSLNLLRQMGLLT